jgi:hypothetical protein
MKKSFMGLVMALFLSLALVNLHAQSQDRGGQSQDHHMGSGMMGRGHGMMHQGPGNDSEYGPQYGPRYKRPPNPLEEKDARAIFENYLNSTRNPNLRLGKIEDKGNTFEAEIVTKKEGALVDRVAIDKNTGWMRSVY